MKNLKRITVVLCLVLALVATVCGCGDKKSGEDAAAVDGVKEVLTQIFLADDVDTVKEYLTEDSYDRAESLVEVYPGTDYELKVEKAGDFEGYELFYYTMKGGKDDDRTENGVTMFKKTDDGYKLSFAEDITNKLLSEKKCSSCSGTGGTYTGGNVCGICGGTGQQYMPSVYYDAALNSWQGQWQACSGCGGAGKTGGVSNTCSDCRGYGFCLK